MINDKNVDNFGFLDDNDESDKFDRKVNPILDALENLLVKLIETAPADIKWPNRKDELESLLKKLRDYKNV